MGRDVNLAGLSESDVQTARRLLGKLSAAKSLSAEGEVAQSELPSGCPLDWQPSVLLPVFSSSEHFDESTGAPGALDIFFPSLGPFSDLPASLLDGCGQFPLVIFLHGNCNSDIDHYKRWSDFGLALARSGYVVVIPELPDIASGSPPWGSGDLDLAQAVLAWMQTGWKYHDALARTPGTAVVGHSYGALLGARLATKIGASAYVGLSGGWLEWTKNEWLTLVELNVPSLFTWGSDFADAFAQLDHGSLWDIVKTLKHKLVFEGAGHWDYLYSAELPCASDANKGFCSLVPKLAADYTALFLSRYAPPEGADIDGLIPPTLLPPTVVRTVLQELLATGHLEGISSLPSNPDCKLIHSVENSPPYLLDRSAEFGTPAARGAPTPCVIPGLGVTNIAYRDTSDRLHELWRDAQGATGTTNLTANASAPLARGNPFAYADTSRNTEILLYRGDQGIVHSLYWSTGPVGHDNLSGTAGAPGAAGDPVGYYVAAVDTHHVIYRTGNGHLHELWWTGLAPVAYGGDLTALASAPPAVGQPSAFVDGSGENIVIYRSADGHIRSLYWAAGAVAHEDLSGFAGTPPAAGDPFAYYTPHDDTHQIVYLGNDGHLWELYWPGVAPVVGWDITALLGAPTAVGQPAAYYNASTNTKHVVYRSADSRLHDICWVPGGLRAHIDLTAAYETPLAADRPAAFEGLSAQHVAFHGTGDHIYEVLR